MSQLIPAEIWTVAKTDQGSAVLVRPLEGDRAVPIFIGPLEAQNILLGLGEVEIPRPLTHDLLLHILTSLQVQLVRVDIHTLNEGTFFSNLVLDNAGKRFEIDARPSDSLALAVRAACPIFIDEDLVDEAGVSLEQLKQAATDSDFGDDEPEPDTSALARELDILREKLDAAVAKEHYEEAANLRDQIRRLEKDEPL